MLARSSEFVAFFFFLTVWHNFCPFSFLNFFTGSISERRGVCVCVFFLSAAFLCVVRSAQCGAGCRATRLFAVV